MGETLGVATETIRGLHNELAVNGLPVSGADATAGRFGPDTVARLHQFQARHGLPVTDTLTPDTAGVLALSSLVTTESDRAKLRTALKDAIDKVPDSPEYSYWLARYAVMAGDYETPHTIAHLHPDFGDLLTDVAGIFDPGPSPAAPEVPFPENFYSYREDPLGQEQLDALKNDVEALSSNPHAYEAYLGSLRPGLTFTVDGTTFGRAIGFARAALAALDAWQLGNRHAAHREVALAIHSYQRCQTLVADYFAVMTGSLLGDTPLERIRTFVNMRSANNTYAAFSATLQWRRILLSLRELEQEDRGTPIGTDGAFASASAFLTTFAYMPVDDYDPNSVFAHVATNQITRLDRLMVVLGTVWVPLAIGEMNCQRRQFDTALQVFADLLTWHAGFDAKNRYLCEFIEVPFIRLRKLEALLDKADAQYKTGATELDANVFPDTATYHGLEAAQTYQQVLALIAEDSLDYTLNLAQGRDVLVNSVQQFIQNKDTTSLAFRAVGKGLTVPTISAATSALPGLDRTLGPHQSIAKIELPAGHASRAMNPRLYAMGLLATAKLEQIRAGFNYLGYPSDYVPPWRFSFLLDRARYFTEHAKNAERDYLSFLNNAEHEEFQEQSLAQNVEMEKSDVRIETARVDQAQNEVSVAQTSADLAALHAQNAQEAADEYFDFKLQADDEDSWTNIVTMIGDVGKMAEGIIAEDPAKVAGGVMGIVQAARGSSKQKERDFAWHQLIRTSAEAQIGATEALQKLDVARSALAVAGLLRQAAILRHEFAVQNLTYLRNRTLNAEQWFRLANAIRGVSDTYLHHAIELAFLAQQAYEFESGRQVEVIRFDYDLSDVGAMLAADFLLRDLDTLEQDLVTSQQRRQQQVRYVLSMAREYPSTLRELADNAAATFSVRLEQLERHFPGLYNCRISSVDLQPVALMDPTRVSVKLTQLGTGMVRLRSQPGTSPLNTSDLDPATDWLPDVAADWPVKIHVSGADTNVFSGLSRAETASLSMITANERGAFEGLPGASSWRIDMSMRDNQVVLGTLADVLITFTLSGYHDSDLNDVVTNAMASQRPYATSSYFSVRESFPDSYYSLVHNGTLNWQISDRMLTLSGMPSQLRNLGVLLPLSQGGPELGRCYCRYPIRVDVSPGSVNVQTMLPEFGLTLDGLTVTCAAGGAVGADVMWDFGDGTPLAQGNTVQHAYTRPGQYIVLMRLAKDGTLVEYRSAVVVSATHPVTPPLIVSPTFSAGTLAADGTVAVAVSLPATATDVSIDCAAGKVRGWADTGPATLNLKPGSYLFDFRATRRLGARFYSKQCYQPAAPVSLYRERIATNRTFDASTGANNTASPSGFTAQVFSGGNAAAVSPVDRWTLELPLAENPWFMKVSASDIAEFDGGEFADAILSLEFLGTQ